MTTLCEEALSIGGKTLLVLAIGADVVLLPHFSHKNKFYAEHADLTSISAGPKGGAISTVGDSPAAVSAACTAA